MSDYMSDLGAIGAARASNLAQNSTNKSAGKLNLDMEDFLQMMVAQFQNQDPENAASSTDMLNQMVQMSMIQAITNITDAATMIYSSSLVGKEVTIGTWDAEGKLKEIVGTVTGTGTYNGSPVVFVDGVSYSISSIMAVGRLPPREDPEDPEQKPDDSVDGAEKPGGDTEKPDDSTGGAEGAGGNGENSGENPES